MVDPVGGMAYVSCMGSDSIFRIDLTTPKMVENTRYESEEGTTGFPFQVKRPRFCIGNRQWARTPGQLYVAPFLSGNNTFTIGGQDGSQGFGDKVFDGYGPDVRVRSGVQGLPDVDLFRITPASGVIEPIFRRVGSLFDGPRPGSDQWQVLDAGHGEQQRAVRVRAGHEGPLCSQRGHGGGFAERYGTCHTHGPLGPGSTDLGFVWYDEARSLPFPYALAFGGPLGRVAVASSNRNRVALMDAAGVRHGLIEWGAGEGAVVRDLDFHSQGLFIYCQGTSEIQVWPFDAQGQPAATSVYSLSLLSDPTPVAIQKGRSIFYDASFSADSRFTCGTCHPGGGTDALVWPLVNTGLDFKDPMMTQPSKACARRFLTIGAGNVACTISMGPSRACWVPPGPCQEGIFRRHRGTLMRWRNSCSACVPPRTPWKKSLASCPSRTSSPAWADR